MGADKDSRGQKPFLGLLHKVAGLCRRRATSETPGASPEAARCCPLSRLAIVRLASALIDSNKHLPQFEVELGDRLTSDAVAEELRARGCQVERDPFKALLVVKNTESRRLHRAA